jgi:hypothetical protein
MISIHSSQSAWPFRVTAIFWVIDMMILDTNEKDYSMISVPISDICSR